MFAPAHLRVPRRDRAILGGSLVALAVAAWLALWLWEGSPYGRYLHHDGRRGPLPLEAALFAVGWVLMIVAMMLPSSVPLVMTFGALVGRRRQPGRLVVAAARRLPRRVGRLRAGRMDRRPRDPRGGRRPAVARGASAADHRHDPAAAGLWQFSPLRDRCLDECRSPLGFVINRWRARPSGARRSAWASPTARSASVAAGR